MNLNPNSTPSRIVWAFLFVLVSALAHNYYTHLGGGFIGTMEYYGSTAGLDAMVDQAAAKPYVGRMLAPLVIGALERGCYTYKPLNGHPGESVREENPWIVGPMRAVFLNPMFNAEYSANSGQYLRHNDFPVRLTIAWLLTLGLFIGIAFGGRAAYSAAYGPGLGANLAGIFLVLSFSAWQRYISYIYDPMTVCLVAWIIYASLTKRLWLTMGLFVLMCINKETALLQLGIVLFQFWNAARIKRDIAFVVSMLAVFLSEVYRATAFASNPGSGLEFHLLDHQLVIYKYAMNFIYAVVVVGFYLWLALTQFKTKPMALRIGFLCTFVPLFLASIPFGYIDETRALYDALPYVVLLALPTLYRLALRHDEDASGAASLRRAPACIGDGYLGVVDRGGIAAVPARVKLLHQNSDSEVRSEVC